MGCRHIIKHCIKQFLMYKGIYTHLNSLLMKLCKNSSFPSFLKVCKWLFGERWSCIESAVNAPVIARVTATVQFLHSNQDHVVRSKCGPGFSRPKVDAVKATSADVRHCLIAVCFSVPGVSAVFLFAQLFPHVAHTLGQTSNLYHLHRQITFFNYATSHLLLLPSIDLPRCLGDWCLHQKGQWHHLVPLLSFEIKPAAVSFSPLIDSYSFPGVTSSSRTSDLRRWP